MIPPIKHLVSGTSYLFLSCWSLRCQTPQKHYRLLLWLWSPSRVGWQESIVEDTTPLSQKTWRNQAGTDLEASFLMASFHSTGQFCVCCMKWKVANSLTQLLALWTPIITLVSRYTQWCNGGMNAIGITSYFLIGFNVYSTRQNSCLVLLTGQRTHGWVGHRL